MSICVACEAGDHGEAAAIYRDFMVCDCACHMLAEPVKDPPVPRICTPDSFGARWVRDPKWKF